MKTMIEEIWDELIAIDPTLRGQEKIMKETIEKLIASKPENGFDKSFKEALKSELLKQFAKSSKKRILPKRHYWGLAALFLLGVFSLTLWFEHNEAGIPNGNSLTQSLPPTATGYREPDRPEKSEIQTPEDRSFLLQDKSPASPQKKDEKGAPIGGLGVSEKKEAGITPETKRESGRAKQRNDESLAEGNEPRRVRASTVPCNIPPVMVDKAVPSFGAAQPSPHNTESYATVRESDFLGVIDNPLSTFSIDVDTASYALVRRYVNQSRLPPIDAVRIEELINYFPYHYPPPELGRPLAIHRELCAAPWQPGHKLVKIAVIGKDLTEEELPPSNLVFLIDVSGSMEDPNKLPLLKEAFKLLVRKLSPRDRVALVVYAGAAGVVLPSTDAREKETILEALDRLNAGGSTAGGAGLALAYQIASENRIKGGNNRIILATDGDFNIGPSSDSEMERLIEREREKGIFLSVLGFGMGNYKDSMMETLADRGNGNYAYIDTLLEARKVLAHDLRKTLFTLAKDVKIQVEFNPTRVASYRLIGYENRRLNREDFQDDRKDAGEMGAGHTVTALYEIIPADETVQTAAPLKYQESAIKASARESAELLTVRVRYKLPEESVSQVISETLTDAVHSIDEGSDALKMASAVAEFGLLLRDSPHKGKSSYDRLIPRIRPLLANDRFGYRHEFLRLVETAAILSANRKP